MQQHLLTVAVFMMAGGIFRRIEGYWKGSMMKFIISIVVFLSIHTTLANATISMYATNVPENARPSEKFREKLVEHAKEIKEKGYIESYSTKYEYLIHLKNNLKYNSGGDIRNTELKESAAGVVTYFPLKTINESLKTKTLGFAPVGSFDKNRGWTGITEIFETADVGLCQFTHLDLKASGGGYSLSEEAVRHDVNGHYTAVEVTGKKNQGFDYEVIWFDELNMFTLNCIHNKFSKQFEEKVIHLAIQIDKN